MLMLMAEALDYTYLINIQIDHRFPRTLDSSYADDDVGYRRWRNLIQNSISIYILYDANRFVLSKLKSSEVLAEVE